MAEYKAIDNCGSKNITGLIAKLLTIKLLSVKSHITGSYNWSDR
ncbi:hypothetical protein [Nostoc sp. 2RC]|nr:hypothetical protein [Nostoc sp. 2RC]